MVCATFLISTYYIMEVTWAIYYFGIAMVSALGDGGLPWDCMNRTGKINLQGSDKEPIFISIMSISSPNPMFDYLLESSHRDDSNKW